MAVKTEKCFYSDIYINNNNILNLACKKCCEIPNAKGGTNFSSLELAKRGENQNFPKTLGGTKALHPNVLMEMIFNLLCR